MTVLYWLLLSWILLGLGYQAYYFSTLQQIEQQLGIKTAPQVKILILENLLFGLILSGLILFFLYFWS